MNQKFWMLAVALTVLTLALPARAPAQSSAVEQSSSSAAAVERLNSNLALLSRSPRDVDALLGAGQAALDLGDVQAANGFFTRANIVNPDLGKAKLGLAIVELALKQPEDAAANFDAADRLGEHAQGHLADRGLAYDLTGRQAKAQRDYQAALRANPKNQKAIMRYAVSLGISGRLADADRLLKPLLEAGNREAWRLRAFIYAMNDRQEDAKRITHAVMPSGLADALDPYMARVSLLSPQQKAAAAHYGDFPSDVLRMPAPTPAKTARLAQADRNGSGKTARSKLDEGARKAAAEARSVLQQASAAPSGPGGLPGDLVPPAPPVAPQAVASAQPAQHVPLSAAEWLAANSAKPQSAASRPAPVQPKVARPAPVPATAAGPVPISAAPPPPPPPPRTLADAVSSLSVPTAERRETVIPADMAAVARIRREREAKEAAERADSAARARAALKKRLRENPARTWVQLAAGKNPRALSFSLKRLRKKYVNAVGNVPGWTVRWGATNRILVGPYRKESSARLVVSKVKKAGGDAFIWHSDAGEQVTRIK